MYSFVFEQPSRLQTDVTANIESVIGLKSSARQTVTVSGLVKDQYTAILTHEYEPNGGHHMVVGTTFGELSVVRVETKADSTSEKLKSGYSSGIRTPTPPSSGSSGASSALSSPSNSVGLNSSNPAPDDCLTIVSTAVVPSKEAILGLYWGPLGIYVGSRNALYFYEWNESDGVLDPTPAISINCSFDILDICGATRSPEKVVIACDDSKSRVYDMNTEKLIHELSHHTRLVEVCTSSEDHVATGGQDGFIYLYDAELRTVDPVQKFYHKSPITNIAINKFTSWLAVAGHGFDAPYLHNVSTGQYMEPFGAYSSINSNVYALAFDRRGCLYWGGDEGTVYKSDGLFEITARFPTAIGDSKVSSVYSISTAATSYGGTRLSAAGAGNGVLMSETSKYWTTFFRV